MVEPYAEFEQWVWRRLSMTKRLAGRERVRALIRRAVREFQPEVAYSPFRQADMAEELATADARYGFLGALILSALLSAVASEVLKLLIQWWKERRENRDLLQAWQSNPSMMES